MEKATEWKIQHRDLPLRLEIPQHRRDFHFSHSPEYGEYR